MRVDAPKRPASLSHLPRAGDLRVTMRDVILALLPCLLFGTWNVGRQVAVSLERLGLDAAPGRRGALLAALGVDPSPDAWLACFLIGAAWVLPLLLVVAATTLAWEQLFARLRERGPGAGAHRDR